ncbi:hypothetical protein NAV28_05930 [Pseudomonas stutzeri]|nr:hypothetical protein [Stutzerimonas degradans]
MSKMSAYRNFKRRERATQLAAEEHITFEEALAQIEAREKRASETLVMMAKSRNKERNTKKEKKHDQKKFDQFEKFKEKISPGKIPVQGGAPSLGKR